MARPDTRPRGGRARGLGAVAVSSILGVVLATAIAPVGHAQPTPDLVRAKELYQSAEAAMKDGRFDDALRDYGASYELSRDPALFFKLGHAHERAGKCEIALVYFARYLREGAPSEPFAQLTRDHIAACGGDPGAGSGASAPPGPAAGSGSDAGSTAGSTAGSAAASAAGSGAAAAMSAPAPGPAGAGSTDAGAGGGSAAGPAAPALIPPTREKVAWLLGGGAIALVALGGVLSYATNSSENDVRDLYAGFGGRAPAFDAQTRKRYDELVDEGRRYQRLAWTAFGLAGAAAVGVAVLFSVGRDEPAPPAVTPVLGPRSAGVSVRF